MGPMVALSMKREGNENAGEMSNVLWPLAVYLVEKKLQPMAGLDPSMEVTYLT
jgi:hypothetical protein